MNWWIEEYKKYHAELDTNYPGNSLKPQLHHVKDLVQDTNSETLLDFGCGKRFTIYKMETSRRVRNRYRSLYDPGLLISPMTQRDLRRN